MPIDADAGRSTRARNVVKDFPSNMFSSRLMIHNPGSRHQKNISDTYDRQKLIETLLKNGKADVELRGVTPHFSETTIELTDDLV